MSFHGVYMSILAYLLKHWKTVAAGAAAFALTAVLLQLVTLRRENEALQAQVATVTVQAERLAVSLAGNQKALVEREADNKALAERHAKDLAALRAAFAQDPEACSWSQEKIPEAVLEALGCAR
jgi:hypothetical protein